MTIHAYTETDCTYPAYVNISEADSGTFVLTVRSRGAERSGNINLTREQLMNLVNDAAEHLDSDYEEADKNKVIASSCNYEAESRRAQALDMALRTPDLSGHRDVLAAAAAYQAHITGQQAVAKPDIAQMVNRFLGWQLPKTFSPDCGISFDGRGPDGRGYDRGWPTGTNLLNAEEARAMFEHVLRDPAA